MIVEEFVVNSIVPFDLLRWSKDEFYNFLDAQYVIKFGEDIEILEADLSFVDDGIQVRIITAKKGY